ncbi:hypothetical protein NG821_03600 [Prevotella cerevisiae]|uniref:Uncharacterized protein n=1 Tax=Segatella cerevisiae TaxID=2053716 RepID=A0ABT1BV15_9BACT|nr:hypothetical protein [Segatella cerevisiae]MCO6024938.1 hypothetical protein [Segatella cerevisiae]
MKNITPDNFDKLYSDPVEQQQIDLFVCREMVRQVNRYIKAMSGSREGTERFSAKLSQLDLHQKEKAIAGYIDLNRKIVDGLDWKIILARALANYSETFPYLMALIRNKRKMVRYLQHIKQTYLRFHSIFEDQGKFGMKDHEGKVLIPAEYDFLRTPYVYMDNLSLVPVIAEKNGKMGLILPDYHNTVVADFLYDDISLRDEYPYFEAKIGKRKGTLDAQGRFNEKTKAGS